MKNEQANMILPWLEHLCILQRPQSITLLGAGNGNSPWVRWLLQCAQPNTTLVEADEYQFAALQRTLALQERANGWRLLHAVAAAQAGNEVPFFLASSAAESSLLPPESLRAFWPNLHTLEVQQRQVLGCSELLRASTGNAEALGADVAAAGDEAVMGESLAAHWLFIDCLPAAGLLPAAASGLTTVDVIVARVLTGGEGEVDPLASVGASLDELVAVLHPEGLRQVALEATRNPSISYALFVRDARVAYRQLSEMKAHEQRETHAKLRQLVESLDVQRGELQAQRQRVLELGQEKVAAQLRLQELQRQLDLLRAEKTAAEKQLKEQREQCEQLKKVQAQAQLESKNANECLAELQQEKQAWIKEKIELLHAFQEKISHEYAWLAHSCVISDDVHQAAQKVIVNKKLIKKDLFDFLVELSDQIDRSGDRVTALSYLNQARKAISTPSQEIVTAFVKRLIKFGKLNEAEEAFTQAALDGTGVLPLSEKEKAAIVKANKNIHQMLGKNVEHGHDLLLSAFDRYLPSIAEIEKSRPLILVEVGTTREDVPGQGSTRKLADFCKNLHMDFITVDMDPHNSSMAQRIFEELGAKNAKAVNMKGEDYLRDYSGGLDFVFLDAYDFDHGKHSELRQSRYQKFLGARIDESECHRMHLDCAESVAKKLSPFGLVCIDDTWLEDGRWTAKGTLAVPYLLSNGFELLEVRNRAALLRRKMNEEALELEE